MEFPLSSVSVRNLEKRFGDYHAIRGADLSAADGEFVTLLGESGCGKTTTLRCLAGLETPSSGRISIGDHLVYDSAERIDVQPERRRTGMVFQSYALWPHLTVLETILYPLRRRKVAKPEALRRAQEILQTVGLDHLATRPATSLSGGQQQRVALARALVSRPELILYDEPLSNLDPSLRRQVRDEILRMHRDNGTTSIYVTHDLEEAMHLSDRIIVMQSGLLEQTGTPAEIFAKPTNEFVAKFVGFENLLKGSVSASYADAITVHLDEAGVDVSLPKETLTGAAGPGEEVVLAFRSANAEIVSGEAPRGTGLRLPGTVERVDFLGSRNEFRILTGTATLRVAESERDYRRQSLRREAGADVWLHVDAELCSVIPTGRGSDGAVAPAPEMVEVAV
ncbi:ABC transporter ATP-binding protein [Microbacterium caowuchunii]|uniref:ABC transporter ATP-binding protein n=1 Tax=Microbacterium caowuchunii TaxID=2614638 RepID=UPI001245159E|nr:ABC transporter ATP-binding protein [Microbacterium caowuchunii]QEW00866.1 ABC transporter ATP-binding protein [Microbacterium caowuchunii]